jgi:uncharacterized membrane protein YfcA
MIFRAVVLFVAVVAGAVAAVSGFGIGSLLTPVLAVHSDLNLAARQSARSVKQMLLLSVADELDELVV